MRISRRNRRLRVGEEDRLPLRRLCHRLLASLDGVGKTRRPAQHQIDKGEVALAYPLQCNKLLLVGAPHRGTVLGNRSERRLHPAPRGPPLPTCSIPQLPCDTPRMSYTRRPVHRRCGRKPETTRSKNRIEETCRWIPSTWYRTGRNSQREKARIRASVFQRAWKADPNSGRRDPQWMYSMNRTRCCPFHPQSAPPPITAPRAMKEDANRIRYGLNPPERAWKAFRLDLQTGLSRESFYSNLQILVVP